MMGIFTETEEEARSWHLTCAGHSYTELSHCVYCLATGRVSMEPSDKEMIRALFARLRKYEIEWQAAQKKKGRVK